MKNIVENQGIKTDKPLPMSYEALKAERDALADKCDRLEYNLGNAIVGEQEALQRVNGLVVENAALKDACGGDGGYRDCPACAHSQYIESPETPATDAALAAIQAHGVEAAAEKLYGSGYVFEVLMRHAAELREDK